MLCIDDFKKGLNVITTIRKTNSDVWRGNTEKSESTPDSIRLADSKWSKKLNGEQDSVSARL